MFNYFFKKNLLSYFLSLTLIQGLNYILQLILIPYLVRKLGPSNFGIVSFSQSFVTYFTLIINYGFELSATKEIAKANEDFLLQKKIFNDTLIVKCFLFIISTIIFFICFLFLHKLKENFSLITLSYLTNVGAIFFPIWFFQGINKFRIVIFFNFLIRLFIFVFVVLFVKSQYDAIFYIASFSFANMLIGFVSFLYAKVKYDIHIRWINFKKILAVLKNGLSSFLTTILLNFYTTTNVVLMGFLSNNISTGYFDASSKVIGVMLTVMLMPLNSILYPKITQSLQKNYKNGIYFYQKIILITLFLGLFLSIINLLFSKLIILIIFGTSFLPARYSLLIMSGIPVLISLKNTFGIQGMLNFQMDKKFLKIILMANFFSILSNFILIPIYSDKGASLTWLLTELFSTIYTYLYIKKHIKVVFNFSILKNIYINRCLK